MLHTVDKSTRIKSESEKFDDRSEFALSNGFLKSQRRGGDSFDYVEYGNWAGGGTDVAYFRRRIAHEMKLLQASPSNAKLLVRVGDIYAANNKPDKAKTFYNRAFQLDRSSLTVANRLVEIFLFKGKPGQADGVLEVFEGELDFNTLHLHAVIKMIQNKLSDAVRLAEQIPDTAKNYHEAANTLGLIKLSQNKDTEARKWFEASIATNANYAPAKSNLALCLQRLGSPAEAVAQYKKTIAEHHEYVLAYHNLFNLYVSEAQVDEALELMESARDLITPTNEIQFRIAWALMTLGRWGEAIVEYERVLELLPDNPNTLNNIGHCHLQMGDTKRAYAYFKRATMASRRGGVVSTLPYRNQMVVAERVGRIQESRRIAEDILVRSPNDAFALAYKGVGLVAEEKWDDALKFLLKAYELRPPLVTLYVSLSFIYADVRPDYDKGMEVCQYVLESKMERWGEIINNYIHLNLVHGELDIVEPMIEYLNLENPVSLSTAALYHLQRNEVEVAQEMYDRAASLSTKEFAGAVLQRKYYDMALYFMDKGDTSVAIANLEKCIASEGAIFKFIKEKAEDFLETLTGEVPQVR